MRIALPPNAKITTPRWSADGKLIAFANAADSATELWVVDVATAKARKLPIAVNAATESAGVGQATAPFDWLPDQHEQATVVWTEALDGGNPKEKVPHRDKLMVYRIGQSKEPTELTKTEHRLQSVAFTDKGAAWVTDYDRTKKWLHTVALNGNGDPRQLFSRNSQDRYKNPGVPVLKATGSGQRLIQTNGKYVFLHGEGASAKGDRPFLDRMDTETLKTERPFQSSEDKFEDFVALFSDDGSRILISRESPTEPRNYFIREPSGPLIAVTNFKDPAPQLRKIKQQLVTYKRPDGVPLSFTLYLPPDYQSGTKLPAVMWA